jgi:hypothetical protein
VTRGGFCHEGVAYGGEKPVSVSVSVVIGWGTALRRRKRYFSFFRALRSCTVWGHDLEHRSLHNSRLGLPWFDPHHDEGYHMR